MDRGQSEGFLRRKLEVPHRPSKVPAADPIHLAQGDGLGTKERSN